MPDNQSFYRVSNRYFRLNKDITISVYFSYSGDDETRTYTKGTIFLGEYRDDLCVYLDVDGNGWLYIPKEYIDFVELLDDGMPDLTPEEWNNIVGD